MNKKDPTEVLNNHIENLVDYLKRQLRSLGMANGLSDSQISEMERDFIARLAFAAIIGDDKKKDECEDCSAKDCCALKKPEKKPEKSEGLPEYVVKALPEYVVKALSYVNDHCNKSACQDCIFCDLEGCKLKYTPNEWRV